MKLKYKALIIALTMTLIMLFPFVKANAAVTRFSGQDRYETAVSISSNNWSSSDYVIISTGEGDDKYADALAGTTLAFNLNAPMLLTGTNIISPTVLNEIKRLKVKVVYLLGGTGVIGNGVENTLKAQGYSVIRLSGRDRYETAEKIEEEVSKAAPISKVYLTTGYKFQYAMASSPYIGNDMAVTLFSDGDVLNSFTKEAIRKLKVPVTIMGGKKIVSANVENELKNIGIRVTRIEGDTPKEFNENVINTLGKNAKGIAVASDSVFADSLSGSAVAAKNNLAILLVNNKLEYEVSKIKTNKIFIFGGKGSVSSDIEYSLDSLTVNTDSYPIDKNDNDLLPIIDSNFKEQLIWQYNGKVNTIGDAKEVKSLWLSDVNDLQGIQYFSNIEDLKIDYSNIKNLSCISRLTNLKSLEVSFCDLQNLNGIDSLDSLQALNVDNAKNLHDISAVKGLSNLNTLSITTDGSSIPIDISYIGSLINIENLCFSNTIVKNENVISNLKKLKALYMNSTGIKGASFVLGLVNLEEIKLNDNPGLREINRLNAIVNLQYLNIDDTGIKDLTFIKDNKYLKELQITKDANDLNRDIINTLRGQGTEIFY